MQALGKFVVYTDYILNKEYIATNLCVNKSKPILKCNGKCHLAKQLKKQDQKEKPTTSNKEKMEVVTNQNILPLSMNFVRLVEKESSKNSYKKQFNLQKSKLNSIFHPPQT